MTVVDPRILHKAVDDMRHALKDLVDEQRRSYIRADNTVTRHVGDSLLQQLRDEVSGSGGRPGGPRRSAPIPIAVDALDLWNLICSGGLVLAAQTGAHIDGPDPEHVLRAAAAAAAGSTDLDAIHGVRLALNGWVKDIHALLEPEKRVALWGQACPVEVCGAREVWRLDERDGETKRTAALEVSFEEVWNDTIRQHELVARECRCLSCGEEWPRGKLLFLAKLLGRDFTGVDLSVFGIDTEGEPAA